MNQQILEDPINRVVCVFDERNVAVGTRKTLADAGAPAAEIHIISNEQLAEFVDTSSKWFADTHIEIERYQDELGSGATILSVPVTDEANREEIHTILKAADARLITHFGEWITEMLK